MVSSRDFETQLSCRFCQSHALTSFVDLGVSPLCQSHVTPEKLNHMEPFYPLHAFVCTDCFLVQLGEFVSPGEIFSSEYAYFSSFSDSWLKHAREYSEAMIKRWSLGANSHVVEIASNDGYLLQNFVRLGIPCLGVEPAANVAEAAKKVNVQSVVRFFGTETAKDLRDQGKSADLLLGNNVLAHVPRLNDFVGGMKILLKPTGVITMEFPHLLRLMDENQFDTIYHEHFSYFSFLTVEKVFAAHGIVLFDVEELSTHGGSLRIYGRHSEDASKPVGERVKELKARETAAGFGSLPKYRDFSDQVKETKRKLLSFLIDAKRRGKTVAGYGAPGKGNTLLNYCGIRTDFIDFTVDRNPFKQGNYLPGSRIPILPPERIKEARPDYLLILPWNLRTEIMSQTGYIREWGGQWVVPIPETKVFA